MVYVCIEKGPMYSKFIFLQFRKTFNLLLFYEFKGYLRVNNLGYLIP